jgi:hypothetical protein
MQAKLTSKNEMKRFRNNIVRYLILNLKPTLKALHCIDIFVSISKEFSVDM